MRERGREEDIFSVPLLLNVLGLFPCPSFHSRENGTDRHQS